VPNVCCFWLKGVGVDASFNFWKGLGVAGALNNGTSSNVQPGVDVNTFSYMAGPRYTYTAWRGKTKANDDRRLQVFAQGLFGGVHGYSGLYPSVSGSTANANSFVLQTGGGLNYYLTKSLGLRLIEADYVRTGLPNATTDVQNDMRLSFGLSYHFQSAEPAPLTLACSASPATIFVGDPVAVTATVGNLDPKLNAIYLWSGAGVSGAGATATVDTHAIVPGNHTVQCGVKVGKPGKEGLKLGQAANATASFTVKAFEPPTVRCSVSPSSIQLGETGTVTASGVSPQNRPLTFSYAASTGTVAGSGSTAVFNSIGAQAGAASLTCNATDDTGQTASAQTTVTILRPVRAPEPEPSSTVTKNLEARLALHSVFFPTDQPKIRKMNAGLVASQQETLTTLAADFQKYLAVNSEAHLILSGHADIRGSSEYNKALSERRVTRSIEEKAELGGPGLDFQSWETLEAGVGENEKRPVEVRGSHPTFMVWSKCATCRRLKSRAGVSPFWAPVKWSCY
jgi:outer membrane protein OmpA-like peptidoglycan-associated protein